MNDVGGCHAAYSLALARRHPRLTAVAFELPAVVPFAPEIIAQARQADRATVREGDFPHEGLGAGCDVALVFALQMLLATESGGLDTRGDWARWLADAGFAAPWIIALPDPIGGTLTVAEKVMK